MTDRYRQAAIPASIALGAIVMGSVIHVFIFDLCMFLVAFPATWRTLTIICEG